MTDVVVDGEIRRFVRQHNTFHEETMVKYIDQVWVESEEGHGYAFTSDVRGSLIVAVYDPTARRNGHRAGFLPFRSKTTPFPVPDVDATFTHQIHCEPLQNERQKPLPCNVLSSSLSDLGRRGQQPWATFTFHYRDEGLLKYMQMKSSVTCSWATPSGMTDSKSAREERMLQQDARRQVGAYTTSSNSIPLGTNRLEPLEYPSFWQGRDGDGYGPGSLYKREWSPSSQSKEDSEIGRSILPSMTEKSTITIPTNNPSGSQTAAGGSAGHSLPPASSTPLPLPISSTSTITNLNQQQSRKRGFNEIIVALENPSEDSTRGPPKARIVGGKRRRQSDSDFHDRTATRLSEGNISPITQPKRVRFSMSETKPLKDAVLGRVQGSPITNHSPDTPSSSAYYNLFGRVRSTSNDDVHGYQSAETFKTTLSPEKHETPHSPTLKSAATSASPETLPVVDAGDGPVQPTRDPRRRSGTGMTISNANAVPDLFVDLSSEAYAARLTAIDMPEKIVKNDEYERNAKIMTMDRLKVVQGRAKRGFDADWKEAQERIRKGKEEWERKRAERKRKEKEEEEARTSHSGFNA